MASGYLSPFPSSSAPAVPSEQAVVSFQGTDEGHLTLLTADTGLNISVAAERTLSGPDTSFVYGVAVGNFDFTDQTLTTLQVAVFTCDGIIPPAYVIGQPFVHLFAISTSLNPQNNQITYSFSPMSRAAAGSPQSCAPAFSGFASIAAGDLQGRSLLLGPPTIVRVQHSQPHMILGMPPSHVDWVTPVGGASPEVLNLSYVFGGFFSSYQTEQTNTDQSSRQSTTSYTQSIFASVTGGYQWGSAQTTGATSERHLLGTLGRRVDPGSAGAPGRRDAGTRPQRHPGRADGHYPGHSLAGGLQQQCGLLQVRLLHCAVERPPDRREARGRYRA